MIVTESQYMYVVTSRENVIGGCTRTRDECIINCFRVAWLGATGPSVPIKSLRITNDREDNFGTIWLGRTRSGTG